MPYIIQTNNLTKSIGGRQLVTDINLHVKKGEIYGFLGPNGAGKTTVMKMITNLWKPTKGTVEVLGEQLRNNSYGVLKRMGSIIDFPVFYESLSGEDNLKLHCEYMGFYQKGSVENSLKMLDLTDAAKKPVKEYSLGMKQRLGIARAILAGPELLVLDEPTNGLDPAGMKQIRELLRMLKEEYNTTILISSHLLPEIEHIADTVGVISRGRMQREVSMKDIAEKNLAYIEISVKNVKRAAYILADSIKLQNFKVLDEQKIRVYEPTASTGELSKALALGGVEVEAIGRQSESLEDYFLKVTEGGR
ncbi:ABC transporter ATP-binding protein [Faecalicatena contorta]|uniref:ABC transporter ATP-binding protein n=1 Tax=Faecalicatena contorta TaxID=39482 RepID=UPI00129D8669|nr:ABC transporter ATP-binding protein [Faecalicatena contorta]MEE0202962.1 ABC transporter ATP-binding protein [Muricomes sp.]MRM89801.1 ABC transporter ATP-binding protein [Faecalicatena contorta]